MFKRKGRLVVLVLLIVSLFLFSGILNVSYSNPHGKNSTAATMASQTPGGVNSLSHNRSSQTVNLKEAYTKEPAPMGIVDYGVGPNCIPYTYNSTSFTGEINISSLNTYSNSSHIKSCRNSMSFQMNLNLKFNDAGATYVYWAQDVIILNSSSKQLCYLDNIWNISNNKKSMEKYTVQGNGQLGNASGLYYYFYCAPNPVSGPITLTYPQTLYLRINTTVINGRPELVFMYQYGGKWIAYDHVKFIFAKNLQSNPAFCVNGSTYEPDGYSFYDAELIMGGPGNGSYTYNRESKLTLSLEYWNGNNYEMISNAYNYGSDTAEGISNTSATMNYNKNSGSVCSNVTSGSGTLGLLYGSNQLGTMKYYTNLNSGYIEIGSTYYHFTNGTATFTLFPGQYMVTLLSAQKSFISRGLVIIHAGETSSLISHGYYTTTMMESGLLAGKYWNIHITNSTGYSCYFSSNSSSQTVYLKNGSYVYRITSPFNVYRIINGNFTLTGNNVTIQMAFIEMKYNLTIHENGMSGNFKWGVSVNGTKSYTNLSYLNIGLTNGTFLVKILAVGSYAVNGTSTYNVSINGATQNLSVNFTKLSLNPINNVNLIFVIIAVIIVVAAILIYKKK